MSKDPSLCEDLEGLVEPVTRGDPESPLGGGRARVYANWPRSCNAWATRSPYQLVSEVLHGLGYSLQANRKTQEGGTHPDRNAQFEHLNAQAQAFLGADEPVVFGGCQEEGTGGRF